MSQTPALRRACAGHAWQVADERSDIAPFRQLVERQWGVVTLAQLRAGGLGDGAVKARVATGRLIRLYHGVYAVGHRALRAEGRLLAAVLACGDGAALSFFSAAAHLDLRASRGVLIDVSVPKQRRPRRGIRVHVAADLESDVVEVGGLRVTCATRVLIDLATRLPLGVLEPVAARAEARGLIDYERLASARSPKLRAILGAGPQNTRSGDESRLLAALRAARLPVPEMNAWVTHGGGEEWQGDAVFWAQRVIVEIDDDTHRTRHAFELDRRKDAVRQADGFRTVRFTKRQLAEDLPAVTTVLARILERG
jgi:very-short-patch-repair endonuclease